MVRKGITKLSWLALLTAAGTLGAVNAQAADYTDVLDAADQVYLDDELVDDNFDIALTPAFKQRHEWAKLKREYADKQDTHKTRLLNELEYERVINEFDIGLEIGMFHDIAFRMNMPIIISDTQSYKFDKSSDDPIFQVDPSKSYLSPDKISADRPYKFFDLKDNEVLDGTKRSGLGDMSFGIAWNPYNTERHYIPERPWKDETGRSTMLLAFDYVAPTGKAHQIDNDSAGRGIHEFIFTVAASHRFKFIDPYIGVKFGIPKGTAELYKDFGANQKRKDPGMWGKIDLGIEFIPYEALHKDYQRLVKIDLRGYFKYTGEGRQFSELADAFGTSNCWKTDDAASVMNGQCQWVAEKWSNAGSSYEDLAAGLYTDPAKLKNIALREDGIFDYEGYATVGGALNLTIMPVQYVTILAGVSADYTADHFVTFTKVGRDRVLVDKNGNIDPTQKDGKVSDNLTEERNPTYSGVLDRSGNRIKRVENLNLEWFVGLKLAY